MRRPPHLPFLAGPPEFTVGLRPIAPEAWIQPDTEAAHIPDKRRQVAAMGALVHRELAEAAPILSAVAARIAPGASDFRSAVETVSDDVCVMLRSEEGWILGGAVLCAPSQWSLTEHFGKPLPHIHGGVPDKLGPGGTQALAARITRVFDGLQPGQVLERFNWTVQFGPDRYLPDASLMRARSQEWSPAVQRDGLWLRVERQTISKTEGAVVFTIRICLDPLAAAFAVDGAKAAFALAWRNAPEHVRTYKRWSFFERAVDDVLSS